MHRYEITNSAASCAKIEDICKALKAAGATRVRTRHAFGFSNQPRVATFAAVDRDAAGKICDAAEKEAGASLIPYQYTGGKWKHNPHTNLSHFTAAA